MSMIPPEAQELIATGNQREQSGAHDQAEADYLQAITILDPDDRSVIGPLYINLGTNARLAGRDADAVRFFETAIAYLQDERGDGLLQSAHAHYNLAQLLLEKDDPAAVEIAREARGRYDRHPFTSPTDRADAAMLDVLARIFIAGEISEAFLTEAWGVIRRADAETLNQDALVNFLINWLSFTSMTHPETLEETLEDVQVWAPPLTLARALSVLTDDGE